MAISDILASIDCDIAQLQQARALLSGGAPPAPKKAAAKLKKVAGDLKKAAGKLKKVAAATKKAAVVVPTATKPAKKKKRILSPEGRKRIAEAAKKTLGGTEGC
jgi:hypothetical protein